MNNDKIKKLENAKRIQELNPIDTLKKVGFKEGMTLCDIGAGTGIFSLPVTEISKKNVYALEISDDMIEVLENRRAERNIRNLIIKKVSSETLPLEEEICDMAIMVTLLHEIEEKEYMINEIKRVLKEKGKVIIIEFHERKTPIGPPIEHRISEGESKELFKKNGLELIDRFSLGENFYLQIFQEIRV